MGSIGEYLEALKGFKDKLTRGYEYQLKGAIFGEGDLYSWGYAKRTLLPVLAAGSSIRTATE